MNSFIKKRKIEIGVFLICFLIQFLLCLPLKSIHYVPDELASISAAAFLSGNDWGGYLSQVGAYYGVLGGILFTPLFALIKDPFLLYKAMLLVVSLISSISSIIAYTLIKRYYPKGTTLIYVLVAVTCCFVTTWRCSNVMNEYILRFVVWMLVILIANCIEKPHKRGLYSIYMVILLWIALMSHTRSIVIVCAIIFVLLIYYILKKEWLYDLKYFIIGIVICFIVYSFCTEFIQSNIFNFNENGTMNNTVSMLKDQLFVNNTEISRFSLDGIRGFFDIATGNVFAITVSTFGTVIMGCWIVTVKLFKYIYNKLKKKDNEIENYFFIALFAVSCLIASVIGFSLLNMVYAALALKQNVTMSLYLYPRYFDIYFGPIFLSLVMWVLNKKINIKPYAIMTVVLFVCGAIFAFKSFLYHQSTFGGDILDAWRVLYPLNMEFNWQVPMYFKNYLIAMNATILVFLLFLCLTKINVKGGLTLILFLFVYQYVFLTFVFDKPYNDFVYDQVNSTVELFNSEDINKNIEVIHMGARYNKRAPYILQYMLRDKEISFESVDIHDNSIIFSSELTQEDFKKYRNKGFVFFALDNNEILITNNKKIKNELISQNYKMQDF